jgi:hypothetical protein
LAPLGRLVGGPSPSDKGLCVTPVGATRRTWLANLNSGLMVARLVINPTCTRTRTREITRLEPTSGTYARWKPNRQAAAAQNTLLSSATTGVCPRLNTPNTGGRTETKDHRNNRGNYSFIQFRPAFH